MLRFMQALVRWHGSRPVSSGTHDVLTSVLVSTGCFVAATPACVVVRGTGEQGRPAHGTVAAVPSPVPVSSTPTVC